EKVLAVKMKSLGDDPQWKMKILRFALGRGYSYDDVRDALASLTAPGRE
ncbi:MAG: hypothetical protein HUJ94_03890, partial [Bacteroidales bacterium]|nr:hypothetical protein [Bacteroidales bacterium]